MKRTVSVHLRLTPEEAKRWMAAAKKSGRTISGWIRWIADGAPPSMRIAK